MTLNENLADLGGVNIAHDAFMDKKEQEGMYGSVLEDEERHFFISFAQLWRAVYNYPYAQYYISTNCHSLTQFRINLCLNNIDRWYELFDVKKGNELYLSPENRTLIW